MLRFLFFVWLFALPLLSLVAQTSEIDSLFTALAQHRASHHQVEVCETLKQLSGLIYATGDYERAMLYADSALALVPSDRPDLRSHLNYMQYSIAAQQWYAYPEERLKLLDTAYQFLTQLQDPELEIPFLNYYGFQLSDHGQLRRALPLLERVETLCEEYPGEFDAYLLASLDRRLDLYKNQGNYAAATNTFRKARKLWQDHPANNNTVSLWNNYAAVLWELEEQEAARQTMRKALKDAIAINDSISVVSTLNSISTSYFTAEKMDSVPIVLEQAQAFLNPVTNPGGAVSIRQNMATYYTGKGMFERALVELEPLAKFCQQPTAPPNCKYVYSEIARNLDILKRYDEIPPVLALSLEQARQYGDSRLESMTYWYLAKAAEATGQYRTAIDHFMRHAQLRDTIYTEDIQKAVANERVLQGVEEERAARDRAELEAELAESRSRSFQFLAFGLGALLLIGGILLWQLQQARTKLRINNLRLAELNATKDKFFGLIAHDLRGPIVALQGVGEQVDFHLQRNRPERIKAVATNISATADGLENLLNQLLQWALLQTGMIPYEPEPVNIAEVFVEKLGLYGKMADNKGISLSADAPAELTTYADPRAVATIIRNLLSNALKFTGAEGQVTLQAESKADSVLLTVRDTGQGMDAKQLDQLFSLTNRSRLGTAGETGSGLGLQLVRELTELNRGKVEVESEVGVGTIFRVWLPGG